MYHAVDNTNNNHRLLRSYISTQDIVLIIAIIYIKKIIFRVILYLNIVYDGLVIIKVKPFTISFSPKHGLFKLT